MKISTFAAFPIAACLTLVGAVSSSRAVTLVVDNQNTKASDTNAGTRELPFKTIGAAAKKVQPGDTVLVRPGVYREAVSLSVSGTAQSPIIFKSEVPHAAIIEGADVVTDLKPETPGVWSFAAPRIERNPYANPGESGEWVYIDGAPLELATERSQLSPATFLLDYDHKRVLVALPEGADIKKLRVEFANRQSLMAPPPHPRLVNVVAPLDDIHIIGFTLQHNADWARGKRAIQFSGQRWLIENNVIRWSTYVGLDCFGTNDCIVRNNLLEWNGNAAIFGNSNAHLLVENNKFLHNNWRRLSTENEGGASKWSQTIDSTVRGNEVAYNFGYGLWFDIHNVGDIMEGNICHDNTRGALFTEISNSLIIRDNIAFNNDIGVIVAESPSTLIERNILWNNGLGIWMRGDYTRQNDHPTKTGDTSTQAAFRQSLQEIPELDPLRIEQIMADFELYWRAPKFFMSNNSSVRDNIVFANNTNYHEDRNYAQASAMDPFVNNFSDSNIWWNLNPQDNFHHKTGAYDNLAQWQKVSGRDEHSTEADPRQSSTRLPEWAQTKRALWAQKFKSKDEINALQLSLVDSPSAAEAVARLRRATTVEPLKLSDSGIKAFFFDVDGQRVLALWTTKPRERRALRLKLNQLTVTLENGYEMQTKSTLSNGAISLTVTHLPIYLRGVTGKITEAPLARARP